MENQIQIRVNEKEIAGSYSNIMQVSHTREEFVLDFLSAFKPPFGALVARVVLSPGHLKRMIGVLEKNLSDYEQRFSKVEEAEEPKQGIGFKTK